MGDDCTASADLAAVAVFLQRRADFADHQRTHAQGGLCHEQMPPPLADAAVTAGRSPWAPGRRSTRT